MRVDLSNDESPNQESLRFKKARHDDVSNSLSRISIMKREKTCSSKYTSCFLTNLVVPMLCLVRPSSLNLQQVFPKQGKYE